MLTLLPLSSLQAAIKRRNSKTSHDFSASRRGSISVYSTYSLPNSKSFMRRYSSFEELDPDQLQMLTEKARIAKEESSLTKFSRRQSVPAVCAAPSCSGLDAQLARIRSQLAQLKSEDIDMTHRVDSLHSSVESLSRRRSSTPSSAPASSVTPELEATALPMKKTESANSLQAIHEECWEICSDSIDSGCLSSPEDSEVEEEEESFEDYCRSVITRIGRTPIHRSGKNARANPISFSALDVEEPVDPKQYCLPNNLELRPKTKSSPQLEIVRNDLSKHDFTCSRPERLSVISCQSDSILFTSQYRRH